MSALRIKALEWERFERGGNSYYAETPLGRYSAWDFGGEEGHFMPPNGYGGTRVEGGLEEAKAAAQFHFNAAVMSVIETTPPS